MANIIKIKRGLKANIAQLELLPGELGVALDTQELYVGDANSVPQLIKGAAAGVVESAEKLSTARNIKISGDATGSAAFDGSADATIALTLATSGVTAGTYNNITVNAKGLVTSASNKVYAIEDITGLSDALSKKANSADVYTKSETYNKATVDSLIAAKDSLPAQSGNAGKFLQTNGSTASWATVDLSSKADKTTVEALTATVATKAAADSVYTKTEIDNKVKTINDAIDEKADANTVYTKTETNNLLNAKANQSTTYTKTEVDTLLNKKANSATTLAGYGITDAYTSEQVDDLLDDKADTTTVNQALANKADASTVSTLESTLTAAINEKATKATTLSGYGITDAYTKKEVDGMVSGTFHFRGEVASYEALPTNAKEGDVYQVGDKEYAWNGNGWVELGFNVDLSAYAKTADVANTYATKTALTEGLATKANTTSVYTKTEIDSKVTTINNSINTKANSADVYTKTQVNTELAKKANTATTLSGYGITDAYTKTQTDALLDDKADAATTLAGYQISDAYTKTEIDNKVKTINNNIATKLDANSVIDGGTFGDAE